MKRLKILLNYFLKTIIYILIYTLNTKMAYLLRKPKLNLLWKKYHNWKKVKENF